MKQVVITEAIKAKLAQSAGPDADVSTLAVFEVSALNTGPIRKRHPLYNGGRHTKQFLEQMAARLAQESVPLQIMHDTGPLPVGRAFSAEVLTNVTGSELRLLIFVDKVNHGDLVTKLNNGTVDQVSVQVMAKAIICSACGFDYLSDEATFENIYSGTCKNGHVIGEDGVHVSMDQLDTWFELSLVGQGGIAGARVLSAPDRRLAASGGDVSALALSISPTDLEKTTVDLKEFMSQLTAKTEELAALKASSTVDAAKLSTAEAEVASLKTKVAELEAKAAGTVQLSVLAEAAQAALTKTGDVTTKLDGKPAEALVKALTESLAKLSATPAEGTSKSADSGALTLNVTPSSAFKRATR